MTTWQDVPDPRDDAHPCVGRCQVVAEERAWRHIAEEHVSDGREPWAEWLTPGLATRFRAAWQLGSTEAARTTTMREVSAIVEKEAKACLGVPLALLYDNYQPPPPRGHTRPEETWNLVLPPGALLVVRSRRDGGAMTTCYFRGSACRATDPRQRWRALVRDLLQTYAHRQADGTFVPPGRADLFPGGDGETRGGVRFRTPTTWRLDGRHLEPWRAMPNPWSLPPTAGPGGGLGARRRY